MVQLLIVLPAVRSGRRQYLVKLPQYLLGVLIALLGIKAALLIKLGNTTRDTQAAPPLRPHELVEVLVLIDLVRNFVRESTPRARLENPPQIIGKQLIGIPGPESILQTLDD
jgi:hypothetical protein